MNRAGQVVLAVSLLVGWGHLDRLPGQVRPRPATPRARSQASTEPTSIKAIFEPVNYGQDINLTDVFFVSPDVGWVSGEHATILKTSDGGKTWTAQVGGDASNNDKPISQLRFLDARHGWAVSGDGHLLRTMDGENWEQVAEMPGEDDYTFVSVRRGILLRGNSGGFEVTDDGGRHWREVAPCSFKVTVQGLAQTADCHFIKLQMLSARVGYVFASWRSPEAPNSTTVVLFRTDDAGEHWSYTVTAARGGRPDGFFIDAEHGVLVFQDKTYVTSDGGKNWRALLSGGVITDTADSHVRFADPEAGWSLGDKYPTLALSYTTDGGLHWKTFMPLKMPGDANAKILSLSLPRRDRAYIAGPHGMVYRYRIVPANYTAANVMDAPLMPAFGATELAAKADVIRRDIEALRSKLPQTLAGDSASNAASQQTGVQTAANAPTPDTSTAAAAAEPGGVASASSPPADASMAEGSALSNDASGGFVQDTSPPSAAVADCCAAALQQLQTDTAGLVTQIPAVTAQYRPLNLVIAGLQLASSLVNQGRSLWTQFRALKHASSIQAASQALQQLSTALDTVQKSSSSGFQNPGGWFAANAPASFVQDVGPGAANTGTVMGLPSSAGPVTGPNGATSPGGVSQRSAQNEDGSAAGSSAPASARDAADRVVNKAKQKLKKIPW